MKQWMVDRERYDIATFQTVSNRFARDALDLLRKPSIAHDVDALCAECRRLGLILGLEKNWIDDVHAWRPTNPAKNLRAARRRSEYTGQSLRMGPNRTGRCLRRRPC